jgi:hypothetical protein
MTVSIAGELEAVTSTESVQAWRVWALTGHRDGSDLRLRPVAGRSRPWPLLRPAEATCKQGRLHVAPNVDCTCGLYGTHGADILRRTKAPAVLGRVALWGRVVEHELGYRAQFAYPQRLRLACYLCFWQWSVPRSIPEVVAWMGRDQLVPLCRPHAELSARYGMPPRALLPAREIELALRAAYAVDPLAV